MHFLHYTPNALHANRVTDNKRTGQDDADSCAVIGQQPLDREAGAKTKRTDSCDERRNLNTQLGQGNHQGCNDDENTHRAGKKATESHVQTALLAQREYKIARTPAKEKANYKNDQSANYLESIVDQVVGNQAVKLGGLFKFLFDITFWFRIGLTSLL
jgi:hypothetical protein